jgi:ATP-dependent Clp protease protease subunit
MFLNNFTKKRKADSLNHSLQLNLKKIKSNNNLNDGDEEEPPDNPLSLPNIFKQDDNNLIYLKNNHLYFHTEVTEESVDEIKKLMRQYWNKVNNIKKTHECVVFSPKPLYLHIFSPGGCAFSGFSLYDFLIEYKKKIPIYTIVEGMAASAATIISIAGTKRFITPNSYMLIHQLSTFIDGNFEQIQDGFENSKKSMEKIMQIYKLHTKINNKKIPNILKHDLHWDAEQCKEYGLIDEIKLIDIFNDDDDN